VGLFHLHHGSVGTNAVVAAAAFEGSGSERRMMRRAIKHIAVWEDAGPKAAVTQHASAIALCIFFRGN
jgi:hypothetical protein